MSLYGKERPLLFEFKITTASIVLKDLVDRELRASHKECSGEIALLTKEEEVHAVVRTCMPGHETVAQTNRGRKQFQNLISQVPTFLPAGFAVGEAKKR